MKPVFYLAAIVVLLLTSAAGFYLGRHSLTTKPGTGAVDAPPATNKILYYRNPMGLADTSPTPKQDSMGMDYLPVYENELPQKDLVTIDSRKIQTLGVQTHTVKQQPIGRDIRALATLEIDESTVNDVSPRFEGWINDLRVNTQGQRIAKGEILFNAIIPNLYYAELAYKQAVKRTIELATAAPDVQRQAELQMLATMERLEALGVPLDEMERLQRGGEASPQITYRSPASGVVLEKNAVQGGRFIAGDRLYRLADLSRLWLKIQLPEQDLGKINTGDAVRVEVLADPGKFRKSKIDFIYPNLNENNRTVQLRARLDNADYALKPGQSAEVWLQSKARNALVIPSNALLDSGQKQWVLVALSEGIYQPRPIQTGERTQEWIEITEGLNEGEQVVTHATFLIDSESRLQAALANFSQAEQTPSSTAAPEKDTDHHHHHHHHPDAQSSTEQ